MVLKPTDLLSLPNDMGHVTLGNLLTQNQIISDREFQRIVYQFYGEVDARIKLIEQIDRLTQHQFTNWTVDQCIKRASRKNRSYSPEQLLGELLTELHNPEGWGDDQTIGERINATGILALPPNQSKRSLFSFLNLYGEILGLDMSRVSDIRRALDDFPMSQQLLQEYSANPDGRFSDALLVACEQIHDESTH